MAVFFPPAAYAAVINGDYASTRTKQKRTMKQVILLIGQALAVSREDAAEVKRLNEEFEAALTEVDEADEAEVRSVFRSALAAKPSIPENLATVDRVLSGQRLPDRRSNDPVKQRLGVGSLDEAKRENIRARDLNQPVNPVPTTDQTGEQLSEEEQKRLAESGGAGGGSGKPANDGGGSGGSSDVKPETAADLENSNTKDQLLALAKKEEVEVASGDNKHEIAKAIVAARKKKAS